MRLGFLIYSYFPYGGQQRDFLNIVNECLRRGHEIDAYCLGWQGAKPDGINVIKVPAKGMTRPRLYQHFTNWMTTALQDNRPDLVIGFNKMPLLDLYFAADPCFEEKSRIERGAYYRFTGRYRHFRAYEESVFGLSSNTEVMILSPQQRRAFLTYYPNCESRLHEMPPGISRDRMVSVDDSSHRRSVRQALGLGDEDLLILQIGSGFKVKGVDRSLQAVAALPDSLRVRCRYLLIGQDKPARFLKLARKLGIAERVTILPGQDDIPRFLAGADLLLHPAYRESAGYVLLEATIAGLPVLTTQTCGYAFHIEQAGSGKVCPEPFSQNELNKHLADMLARLDDAPWSANGLEYGKQDELYRLAEAATDLIENMASAGRVSA